MARHAPYSVAERPRCLERPNRLALPMLDRSRKDKRYRRASHGTSLKSLRVSRVIWRGMGIGPEAYIFLSRAFSLMT